LKENRARAMCWGCNLDYFAPEQGWIKLNTNTCFCPNSRVESAGIVAWGDGRKVLLIAWRMLQNCGTPEKAEAEACLQGLRLIAEWIDRPTYVESDCTNLIHDLVKKEVNRFVWCAPRDTGRFTSITDM
jgi:hypothetical protein